MPPKRATLGRKATVGKRNEQSLSFASRKSASSVQSSASSTASICTVCEQHIEDGKYQAPFCEGICQQWLYSYCAGVPVSWFATLSKSDATLALIRVMLRLWRSFPHPFPHFRLK